LQQISNIIMTTLKVENMAGTINLNEDIALILTIEEYELFKGACMELLGYYELNRRKAKKVISILEKLEKGRNKKN